jgi:hypothetical protein
MNALAFKIHVLEIHAQNISVNPKIRHRTIYCNTGCYGKRLEITSMSINKAMIK